MKKKRKGVKAEAGDEWKDESCQVQGTKSSNLKSHYSLEDYDRLNKRLKDEQSETPASHKTRLDGVVTVPPCSASFVLPGRGIKRKIGCIDMFTQTGRKNKIDDDYILGRVIGHGKFGSVLLCKSKETGVEFACKTLHKGEETVHKEVEIMQHLSGHPGIVMLNAVYEESDCFHLVMELCSGGRLIDRIVSGEGYSEQRTANIFKHVMLVIRYCHEMGVVHRDIKPENILLTRSGNIKLADFGLAMRITNGQSLSGLAGSPAYVAPEILEGNYSEKVDIWSAGVLLHVLLVGFLPFQGGSMDAIFEAVKSTKLDFHTESWDSISKPARDLVARLLIRDASDRISADEVLRHPWILFHTEMPLSTFSVKSRSKSQRSPDSEEDNTALSPPLVDALAAAVSRVKISEPKRTRICTPTGPIEQQCSANLTPNNLCEAC